MTSPFDGLPGLFVGTFGQAVEVSGPQGFTLTTTGIFNPRPVDALGVAQSDAMLHIRTEDAASLADGMGVLVGGESFIIRVLEPDGKGMTAITLEVDHGA